MLAVVAVMFVVLDTALTSRKGMYIHGSCVAPPRALVVVVISASLSGVGLKGDGPKKKDVTIDILIADRLAFSPSVQ